MIFCSEKQWLSESTFAVEEKDLFFGICSSVPFTPNSLASTDFSRKFFLLFLSQGISNPKNAKVCCLKYINVYSKIKFK